MKQNIRERIQALLIKEREKVDKEIQNLQIKQDEIEFDFGQNGAYRRVQTAIDRRNAYINQLKDFQSQFRNAKMHQDARMYIFGCRKCGAVIMVSRQPFSDWHECPVCRQMINANHLGATDFEVVDTGEPWISKIRRESSYE